MSKKILLSKSGADSKIDHSTSTTTVSGFLSKAQQEQLDKWNEHLMFILYVLKDSKIPTHIDIQMSPGVFVVKAKHVEKLFVQGILLGSLSDFVGDFGEIKIPLVIEGWSIKVQDTMLALYEGSVDYLERKAERKTFEKARADAIEKLTPELRKVLGL